MSKRFAYLSQTLDKLKKLADNPKNKRKGLEVIGECLVEFLDLASVRTPKLSKGYVREVKQAKVKIVGLLDYLGIRCDVESYRKQYFSLVDEIPIIRHVGMNAVNRRLGCFDGNNPRRFVCNSVILEALKDSHGGDYRWYKKN